MRYCSKCKHILAYDTTSCQNCAQIQNEEKARAILSQPRVPSQEKEVKFCSGCGEELGEVGVFCPRCGAERKGATNGKPTRKTESFCRYCGWELGEVSIFCPKCGTEKGKNRKKASTSGKIIEILNKNRIPIIILVAVLAVAVIFFAFINSRQESNLAQLDGVWLGQWRARGNPIENDTLIISGNRFNWLCRDLTDSYGSFSISNGQIEFVFDCGRIVSWSFSLTENSLIIDDAMIFIRDQNPSQNRNAEPPLENFDILGDWEFVYDSLGTTAGELIEFHLTIDSFDGEAIEGAYFFLYLSFWDHRVFENSGRFYLNQRYRHTQFYADTIMFDYYYSLNDQDTRSTRLVIDQDRGIKLITGYFYNNLLSLVRVDSQGLSPYERALERVGAPQTEIVGRWREIEHTFFNQQNFFYETIQLERYENIIYNFYADGTFTLLIDSPYHNSGTIYGRYRIEGNRLIVYGRTSNDIPDTVAERIYEFEFTESELALDRVDGGISRILIRE